MKSIEAQIARMAELWPDFAVANRGDRHAIWEGPLQPVKRSYKVRIAYRTPLAIEMVTIHTVQPRVQVLQPLLERHPEFEEGPLPHVYTNERDPGRPCLCLFDPQADEWSMNDLVAETTVLWAARWLFFYEGWLLTGRWRGGGRHPGPANDTVAGEKRLASV